MRIKGYEKLFCPTFSNGTEFTEHVYNYLNINNAYPNYICEMHNFHSQSIIRIVSNQTAVDGLNDLYISIVFKPSSIFISVSKRTDTLYRNTFKNNRLFNAIEKIRNIVYFQLDHLLI